jgi:hypothetical protein
MGDTPKLRHAMPVADALTVARRQCNRWLPYWQAEDMAAEMVARELTEHRRIGAERIGAAVSMSGDRMWIHRQFSGAGTRAADVIRWIDSAEANAPTDTRDVALVEGDHFNPAWIRLEARKYRSRIESRRLAMLTESGELPDMEDEDFTERAADADEPKRFIGPYEAYRLANEACRRLELPTRGGCREVLAQGLADCDAQTLADALGFSRDNWRQLVARGSKLIRHIYPTCDSIADGLGIGVATRQTPPERRRVGKPSSATRQANVLLAKPQKPGRKPTAVKLTPEDRHIPAPAQWATCRTADVLIPHRLLMKWAEVIGNYGRPVSGARPHRAAQGCPPELSNYNPADLPLPEPDGWGFIRRTRTYPTRYRGIPRGKLIRTSGKPGYRVPDNYVNPNRTGD